jgi:hypothetical protein
VVDNILGRGTSREVADVECEKRVLSHGGGKGLESST